MARPLPPEDLVHIYTHARPAFDSLRDANLFITGGTGFFGHWLLESLLYANAELHLNVRATVLTRNAAIFRAKSPHIAADAAVTLIEGDIRSFAFPATAHTHVIHAATDTVTTDEAALAESILAGTRHALDFASQTGAQRFLYISSGAVHGRGIMTVSTIPEDFPAATLAPHTYDSAKREAEALCLEHPSLHPVIARCFAFVGPHLPLDQHFAIGNFIRNALRNEPIHIKGDGTPLRSFLYMSDLAIWLWTMLTQAPSGSIYNVGSDESVSIAELARATAATLNPALTIQIDGAPSPAVRPATYVPDITRAQRELKLAVTVPLSDAIRRTAAWHGLS